MSGETVRRGSQIRSVGVIGSRTLGFQHADKVGLVTEDLLGRGYHIASGGAIGTDQFVIDRLLDLGRSHEGTVYAAWKNYPGFPVKVRSLVRTFKERGGCLSPMTTSHAFNRSKKQFFYYRCMSTKRVNKSKCSLKHVSMPKTDQRVLDALEQLTEPLHLKPIENQILKHNLAIGKEECVLEEQIQTLEAKISAIKEKRGQYLDAIMSQPFLAEERAHFNERLAELSLETKQLQNMVSKARLDLSTKIEERLNFLKIKERLIRLKENRAELLPKAFRDYLQDMLKEVICYPDCLSIQLKDYPWPIQVKG